MKHIFKFIFNSTLLLLAQLACSQNVQKDTVVAKKATLKLYSIRFGTDLNKLAKNGYDHNYKGWEITSDIRFSKKKYLAVELGTEEKQVEEPQLQFVTKGNYYKIGLDFNAYENWGTMDNQIYTGLRYGFSQFSQTLTAYKIYTTQPYYGDNWVTTNTAYKDLNAHWIEVLAGVKAALFRHVYLGFSVRLHYLISQKKPQNFDNLYIPGFNRTYEGKFGAGINYTLMYQIPIAKQKNN